MIETPATNAAATEPDPDARSKPRFLVALLVVAVLVVVGSAAAGLAYRNNNPSYAAQVGRMHQGCQQWAASPQATNGPNEAWCSSMADWMNTRVDQGPMAGQRTGAGMWQDPTAMRETCGQWMAATPAATPAAAPAGADTSAWCGQMVDWMTQHMGNWDTWMMNGPMMGNP